MSFWGGSSSSIPKINSSKKVISLSKSKNNSNVEDQTTVDSLHVTIKGEHGLVEVKKSFFFQT